ncbi:MAG: SpoIID/LytB domain-containing protein [Bacteroidales bacterium]
MRTVVNSLLLFMLLMLQSGVSLGSQDSIYLKIRIFTNHHLKHLTITPVQGNYKIITSQNKSIELTKKQHCTASVKGKKVVVKLMSGAILISDTVKIVPADTEGLIKLKAGKSERKYNDEIILYISGAHLRVINRVELENYTAGVVLSEGGDAKNSEFFKLQSLISRTYALKNIRKHESEGYHLCDQVHCQLYHGSTLKSDILEALSGTKGLVILGPDSGLISAAFHSNSGGETTNSENVWSLPAPYLIGIPDSFSVTMPMAKWEKKIPRKQWINKLKTKYNFPVHKKVMLDSALQFTQEHRKVNYINGIPLKELRKDFKLRSTFFDIIEQGEYLLVKGKGYGHGVGLSQEGAIRMAREGFSFPEIIKFYYKDVIISTVDTSLIPRKK